MNHMIIATTILSFAVGTAAYAGTPSPDASTGPRSGSSSVTLSAQSVTSGRAADAANPNVPGATGRAMVPGDRSTIVGDELATQMERTGSYGE